MSTTPASAFENIINDFISKVSFVYGIDHSELSGLWYKAPADGELKKSDRPAQKRITTPPKVSATSSVPASSNETNAELTKMTKVELAELCKRRGLKCSGGKQELIVRLGGSGEVPEKKTEKASEPKAVPKPATKAAKEAVQATIVKNLVQVKPVSCVIKKNEFGNYWHAETHLVFNRDAKKFFGKQSTSGTVVPMTQEDVEICKKYNFPYVMPENLSKTEKVVVTELEEDDITGAPEDDEDEVVDDEDEPAEEEELPADDE